jgi:hypothetical protein
MLGKVVYTAYTKLSGEASMSSQSREIRSRSRSMAGRCVARVVKPKTHDESYETE